MSRDRKAHREILAYQNTDSSHTGDTAETILCSLSIPANSIGANDVFNFESQPEKSSSGGTLTYRAYLGPTNNSLVGATLIGTLTFAAANRVIGFRRKIVNKNSSSTNDAYPTNQSASSDDVAINNGMTATNINFTGQLYFMITAQLAASGDTATLGNVQCYANYVKG